MSNNQYPNRTVVKRSSGFFQDLTDRFRLISRLMMDSRVNPLVKLLPVGALAYVVWPIDIPGPIDDAFILWLGTTLFVQLCPPDVVDGHLRDLRQRAAGNGNVAQPTQQEDIIDGEFFEADPNGSRQNTPR